MGHVAAKAPFRQAGEKVDELAVRAPWSEALHRTGRARLSEEEVDLQRLYSPG